MGNECCAEPSLDELFGDSAMRLLMRRDGVTESDIRALLGKLEDARAVTLGGSKRGLGVAKSVAHPTHRREMTESSDAAVAPRIISKKSSWKAVAFAAGFGLSTLSYPVQAATTSGGDTVQGLYDALLNTMKNGRTLGRSGRFTRLAPVIRRSFDIASMARLSVGPSWAGLSEAQRQQVSESFERYISAIYADRFDSYDGLKLEVTGEQPAASGVMVRSQIIKATGEPVKVDYMMRRNGEAWLISDIYLDGAVSEVATRRSEFAAILKTEGIDGLIAALNRKADLLTGTMARSF